MFSITKLFAQGNLPHSPELVEKFTHFLTLFQETNSKINLSAIQEPTEIIIKHFIDSLLITKALDLSQIKNLIDVGSGGGFPGLPLAIMFPKLRITVCDSIAKKMQAVQIMSKKLNLKNIKTVIGRAEELGQNKQFREQYDLATARAVATLPTLLEYLSPLVKKNGFVVVYKGKDYPEELKAATSAINKLSLILVKIHHESLPEEKGERFLLVFQKISSLSFQYPRRIGIPPKNPL
jgi:16S rRNA (guanine527-N7)-methyltransferase